MENNGKIKYSIITALYYAAGLAGALGLFGLWIGLAEYESICEMVCVVSLFAGIILFAAKLTLRYKGAGKGMPVATITDLLPFEIAFGLAFGGFMGTLALMAFVYNFAGDGFYAIPVCGGAGVLFFLDMVTGSLAARAGERRLADSLLIVWLFKKLIKLAEAFFTKFPMFSGLEKICSGLMIIQVIALFAVAANTSNGFWELALILFLLTVAIDAFVLLAFFQMKDVKKNLKAAALGKYEDMCEIKNALPQIKDYMTAIDDIEVGQRNAAERLLKSERMKTELITNVSHDLRTPLTSIVNYVDLLDREKLDNEKAAEYIEVLKRQSAKLKKLTDDLIEVSKATSGNIEMKLEDCDVSVLIGQAEGEFSDKLKARDLKLEISGTEEPVNVTADGRYLWRVFDNLLSNITKYAMPGSRVYIDVVKKDEHTSVIFKNISEEKLNITADELMERFVRGDSSRSTEGSGLGLSIADSLMKMMKGELVVTVDGDLFKAECRF